MKGDWTYVVLTVDEVVKPLVFKEQEFYPSLAEVGGVELCIICSRHQNTTHKPKNGHILSLAEEVPYL